MLSHIYYCIYYYIYFRWYSKDKYSHFSLCVQLQSLQIWCSSWRLKLHSAGDDVQHLCIIKRCRLTDADIDRWKRQLFYWSFYMFRWEYSAALIMFRGNVSSVEEILHVYSILYIIAVLKHNHNYILWRLLLSQVYVVFACMFIAEKQMTRNCNLQIGSLTYASCFPQQHKSCCKLCCIKLIYRTQGMFYPDLFGCWSRLVFHCRENCNCWMICVVEKKKNSYCNWSGQWCISLIAWNKIN